jgi:hypothetical protein
MSVAPFSSSNMCSTQADNNYRKLQLPVSLVCPRPDVRLVAHMSHHLKWVCLPANIVHFYSAMSDNNIDPVMIWLWLRRRKRRRQEIRKHWVHPFFRDNFNSRAYIVSKELTEDPELFNSFYRMSIESVSLIVDFVGPQIRRQNTHFRTAVSAEERLLIILR